VPISPIKRAPTRLCGRASRQVGAEDRIGLPFDGFKEELRNPANDMPAYAEAVLSDKDIVDIYALVESLPGPRSSKDISILNNLGSRVW